MTFDSEIGDDDLLVVRVGLMTFGSESGVDNLW